MQRTMNETNRRRQIQEDHNREHGIVPKTIYRSTEEILQATSVLERVRDPASRAAEEATLAYDATGDTEDLIGELERVMHAAAAGLEFEKAAQLRDEIDSLKEKMKAS